MPDFSIFCFEMGLHQNIYVYFGSAEHSSSLPNQASAFRPHIFFQTLKIIQGTNCTEVELKSRTCCEP